MENVPKRIKEVITLSPEADERVRSNTRRRGDLSYIIEQLILRRLDDRFMAEIKGQKPIVAGSS